MSASIYALSTPPGKSGVAVLRLSGENAYEIGSKLAGQSLAPRYAHYARLRDANGGTLDEAVVIYFQAPASFTGEDVVEFQLHGSRAGIHAVSAELEELGAKLAEPGEFTRRALENGKLDMLQIEALADFIDSDTEIQRKQTLNGFSGRDSAWVNELRDKLVHTMSLVTLAIDFSDEELPDDLLDQVGNGLNDVTHELQAEIVRSERAARLRKGFHVAILGKPNVGKSSLLNAIAGRDVAIATEIPGTTRDVIEVFVDLDGLPVIFLDTAGLRETSDVIEGIGVERARRAAEEADLRVFLFTRSDELDEFAALIQSDDIVVQSKSDVVVEMDGQANLHVSSKTGDGVDELLSLVKAKFELSTNELGRFSHKRQIDALHASVSATVNACDHLERGALEIDLVAEYLRQAVFALDHLLGRVDVEDMLDVIFSQFCLGK